MEVAFDYVCFCSGRRRRTRSSTVSWARRRVEETGPIQLEITSHWDALSLYIDIRDYGPGLSREQIEKMGKPISSDKPGGLGLGLFLTHSSLNRHGGRVSLLNADGGGLLTSVVLPLKAVCS